MSIMTPRDAREKAGHLAREGARGGDTLHYNFLVSLSVCVLTTPTGALCGENRDTSIRAIDTFHTVIHHTHVLVDTTNGWMQSLYTFAGNKDGFKALVAAEYASVSLDLPPFRMGVDNKSSDFFKMSPRGQLPVLETQEGCLYESNAIARYIARVGGGDLTGATAIENGEIESWIDYCSTSIDAPLQSWVYPLLKVVPRDKVLPSQLIPEEDERIVRVLAMRDASPRERHS